MKIRQQLRFYGRVQGVGFRYTAYNLAKALGLTGWVLNDYDGSVLSEVQGEENSIKSFIDNLDKGIFIEIDRIEKLMLPVIKNEASFEIRD